jgi:chromosomal replication initiation ATPase DnaA
MLFEISNRGSKNVRGLERALIRLAAYASLSKRRIDLELAQDTLDGERRSGTTKRRARSRGSATRAR